MQVQPKLHLTTFSTSPEKAQFMEKSAQQHGLIVENLATKPWKGWQDRVDAIYAKLNSLSDTDIYCFIDAYDLLVNADEQTILNTFLGFKKPIVFGAETVFFPPSLKPRENEYPVAQSPFRFLNGGCFIGYVGSCKRVFEWGAKHFTTLDRDTDQGLYNTFLLEHPGEITLDTQAKFVLNMQQVPWNILQIEGGQIRIPAFGPDAAPCFVHFNGMSYMDRDHDFVDLGNGQRGFDYHKVYSRTFLAILGAKFVTKNSPLRVQLTSNGHTYS
jgi:hypothetical protein